MESPRWSRLLAGPVDPWREEPSLEGLLAGLVTPWEGPCAGAGEEGEEEGAAETMCDELTTTPIPHPLRCLG